MQTNSLVTAIISSFVGVKLLSSDIEKDNSNIDIMERSLDRQEDGTYEATVTVVTKGDTFLHEEGDLKVTQAEVSFDLHLQGCTLDKNNKVVWDANKGGTYTTDVGNTAPNILTYNGNKVLNDCENDNYFTGGLTENDDRALSNVLVKNMFDWTTPASLNKSLRDIAASINVDMLTVG